MPEFDRRSQMILKTCRPELQLLFAEVVKSFRCKVVAGRRGFLEQENLRRSGESNAYFGESPHNFGASFAVDVVPDPLPGDPQEMQAVFAEFVYAIAQEQGIEIRWGGDLAGEYHLSERRAENLAHFELAGWRERVNTH